MALSLPPIDVSVLVPIPPNISDLTTGAINGTGSFDVMMQVVKLHLQEEYDAQRITGKEYATVYIGAMTAVMQSSVGFLANINQARQLNAQFALIRQQVVTELAKTDINIPAGLGFNETTDVLSLMAKELETADANIAKLIADTANQIAITNATVSFQTAQMAKMITDSSDQNKKVQAEVDLMGGQEDKLLTDAADQHDKLISDTAVNTQAIEKSKQDIIEQERKVTSDLSVDVATIGKVEGEELLLGQKTISELAKTCDAIPPSTPLVNNLNPWLNTAATIQGTTKKQSDLYTAQTDGFTRDAEQKLAKIMVDTFSVRVGADDKPLANEAGLQDAETLKVLNAAKAGIGVAPAPSVP